MHPRARDVFALSLLAASPLALHAEVKSAAADGFVVVQERRVAASAAKVFAALPSIGRWWSSDHTYSGDASKMTLKAEAGSCFCERWSGGEIEHGRVVAVMRDQLLRLQAPLGPLQGRAVNAVLTFQLKPDADKATLLTLTYVVNGASGSALDKSAPGVDGVLGEQMDRLVRYVETGQPAAP